MLDLIAHHAVLSNPTGESVPLPKAFRRLLQILACGIFLPGSVGLTDPCASGPYRIHTTLTLEEQDQICMISQTLLRALAHGAIKRILALEEDDPIRFEKKNLNHLFSKNFSFIFGICTLSE